MTIISKPQSFLYTIVSNNNGNVSTSKYALKWVDFKDSVQNPRYKSLIKAGSNATTPFSGSISKVEMLSDDAIHVTYGPPSGTKQHYSVSGPFYDPSFRYSSPSVTSANNAALGKFYSSARKAMSAMQGMTFLGEIAETIHMIRHPASRLRAGLDDYLSTLKKRAKGVKSKRELNKIVAGTYLEYVFGWVPLIQDSLDALQAYNKLIGADRHLQCRGYGSSESYVYADNSVIAYGFNPSIQVRKVENWTAKVEVIYYGAIKGSSSGVSLGSASDIFGFRADEFIPTLWELLPWSFLIDYFTNIGDIVSASSYVNSNLSWYARTVRITNSFKLMCSFDEQATIKANPGLVYAGGGGSMGWNTTTTTVSRTIPNSIGIPGLEFSLPGSNAKWANIGALLLQSRFLSSLF